MPHHPLAEHRRIVAKVEQLMAMVGALEQKLAASRATAAIFLTALSCAHEADTPGHLRPLAPSSPPSPFSPDPAREHVT